ncbi:MAG: helix-turn-helix domain-containing protein [bacterium]
MNYLIIFLKEKNEKQKSLILDFLRGLLGASVKTLENKELVISYDEIEEIDFSEISNVLVNDFSTNLTLVELKTSEVSYIDVLIELYNKLEIHSNNYLTEKSLLILSSKVNNELIKKSILKKYANDLEMLNIIKVFLECDLNTSVAATKLYLHRNTLINKIDKFINVTGYDVKKFTEASIIYKLL